MTNPVLDPLPRPKAVDHALFRAIQAQDLDAMREALDKGANPNAFRQSRYDFPLTRAAFLGHPERQPQKAAEMVQMLLDAGADPLFQISGGKTVLNTYRVITNEAVRKNPDIQKLVAPQAQTWAEQQPEDGEDFKHLLRLLGDTQGVGVQLLDALWARPSTLSLNGRRIWWETAMHESTGKLMEYALDKFDPQHVPDTEWVLDFLSNGAGQGLQNSKALITWLSTLSMTQQANALLGEPDQPGLLAATASRFSAVSGPVWKHLLDSEYLMSEAERRGLLPGLLVLSMKSDVEQSKRLIDVTRSRGMELGQVKMKDVHSVDLEKKAWGMGWVAQKVADRFRPSPDASLLEIHLRRNDQEVSVSLCRQLIKAGVKPDFGALEALCAKMTYPAKDRVYMKLFEEWTGAGGVDPMPEGKTPVWEQLPSERKAQREFLEARCHQKRMDRRLASAGAQVNPTRRPRM